MKTISLKITRYIDIPENRLHMENIETGEQNTYDKIKDKIKLGEPWNVLNSDFVMFLGERIQEEIELDNL